MVTWYQRMRIGQNWREEMCIKPVFPQRETQKLLGYINLGSEGKDFFLPGEDLPQSRNAFLIPLWTSVAKRQR